MLDDYARDRPLRATTLARMRRSVAIYGDWCGDSPATRDLRDARVSDWVAWLCERYRPKSAREYRGDLLALWRYAACPPPDPAGLDRRRTTPPPRRRRRRPPTAPVGRLPNRPPSQRPPGTRPRPGRPGRHVPRHPGQDGYRSRLPPGRLHSGRTASAGLVPDSAADAVPQTTETLRRNGRAPGCAPATQEDRSDPGRDHPAGSGWEILRAFDAGVSGTVLCGLVTGHAARESAGYHRGASPCQRTMTSTSI